MSASVLSRQLSRLRTLGLIKKVAHTFYEQKVVKAFRELGHKSLVSSFCASRAEARNRVKGRPKPGASEPLTRRRVRYADEGWRAWIIALASLASLDAYLPRQHLLQFEVCVLGLKPVIARVRLQCLTHLLSAGAWPASSCMRVTLEFLQEACPI